MLASFWLTQPSWFRSARMASLAGATARANHTSLLVMSCKSVSSTQPLSSTSPAILCFIPRDEAGTRMNSRTLEFGMPWASALKKESSPGWMEGRLDPLLAANSCAGGSPERSASAQGELDGLAGSQMA